MNSSEIRREEAGYNCSESLIDRKPLMIDGYREHDKGALDVLHGAVFRLYRQIPPFGLTPIGKNAHIAQ